ncbi:hypothetical protein GB937_007130 [Aspergillus fischeri]|nr:hypothetical protein GB937_007130 [Aspergillus fischeri]
MLNESEINSSDLYPKLNLETIPSSRAILSSLPKHANQTHVVYTKIQKLSKNHNVPYAFFNHTSWRPQSNPSTPLLYLPHDKWDENQLYYYRTRPDVGRPGARSPLLRSTRLQSFIGWGSYNPFTDAHPPGLPPVDSSNAIDNGVGDASPYDLSRAVLRDTVQIPSRGYAVLRFRAENPGVWLFHCHIVWHLANGMAMVVPLVGRSVWLHRVHDSGKDPHIRNATERSKLPMELISKYAYNPY